MIRTATRAISQGYPPGGHILVTQFPGKCGKVCNLHCRVVGGGGGKSRKLVTKM